MTTHAMIEAIHISESDRASVSPALGATIEGTIKTCLHALEPQIEAILKELAAARLIEGDAIYAARVIAARRQILGLAKDELDREHEEE